MEKLTILVTGGARSGKSAFAEKYAARKGDRGIYIATSRNLDQEMDARIEQHRLQREKAAFRWHTIEEPIDIVTVISQLNKERPTRSPIILVDCLTVWIANVMFPVNTESNVTEAEASRRAEQEIDRLVTVAKQYNGTLILVTNEVGDGIVPAYVSGRLFRDVVGRMNQQIAAVSEEVFLVTAGIPVSLTKLKYEW